MGLTLRSEGFYLVGRSVALLRVLLWQVSKIPSISTCRPHTMLMEGFLLVLHCPLRMVSLYGLCLWTHTSVDSTCFESLGSLAVRSPPTPTQKKNPQPWTKVAALRSANRCGFLYFKTQKDMVFPCYFWKHFYFIHRKYRGKIPKNKFFLHCF